MPSKSIAEKIYNHPDREELISKLLMDEKSKDIAEWLDAKYCEVEDKNFQLPVRVIEDFRKHNLDFYTIMKNDLAVVRQNKIDPQVAITADLQNNSKYKDALARYANSEVDVKRMINNLCAAVEMRFEQVFNELQTDVTNFKFDRVLIEYVAVLKDTLKECHNIVNGPGIMNQTNIQNNFNLNVMDTHINTIYDIIREILSDLDYDTSIKFIEIFNERMSALKASENIVVVPVENRLAEAKQLSERVENKLGKVV